MLPIWFVQHSTLNSEVGQLKVRKCNTSHLCFDTEYMIYILAHTSKENILVHACS